MLTSTSLFSKANNTLPHPLFLLSILLDYFSTLFPYVNMNPLVSTLKFELLLLRIILPRFYEEKSITKEIKMEHYSQIAFVYARLDVEGKGNVWDTDP